MPKQPALEQVRKETDGEIIAKSGDNQNWAVPDLKTLDEDRPVAKVTTSLTQLMRDLLEANHGAYAKLLVNCWYRQACLGNQAAIAELLKRLDGIPPSIHNEPFF